ncbi:uncharacterized protein LOC132201073 isoform X2 [Neocloeon triangulifer]|uniref:uncharacterized protein LOC132201073 isoform X2 n=1 Tax=Neocloeon triangulifer TaxID=2078957 RepID=UPI00286F1325|nr:uncharacterized protein LOC132201073 isoform X2 [Neocloeon triangulifer]
MQSQNRLANNAQYEFLLKKTMDLDSTQHWVMEALGRPVAEKKFCSFVQSVLELATYNQVDFALCQGNVKKLYKKLLDSEDDCLSYTIYFLRVNKLFSLSYLKLMQDRLLPCNAVSKVDQQLWNSMIAIEFCSRLNHLYHSDADKGGYGPLGDPYAIFEIPWCPTRFHQWLCPAVNLANALNFAVLEFTSWHFPKHLSPLMMEVLLMVKKFKERVLFGIALLGAMVNQFPKFDPKIPAMILDDVLLHCAPIIKWYVNDGISNLRSFKKLIWPGDTQLLGIVEPYPEAIFALEPELEELSHMHIYSYDFWANLKSKKLQHLFGNVKNYEDLSRRLKKKNYGETQINLAFKKFSDNLRECEEDEINQSLAPVTKMALELLLDGFQVLKLASIKQGSDSPLYEDFLYRLHDIFDQKPEIVLEVKELHKMKETFNEFNNPICLGKYRCSESPSFNDFKCHFHKRLYKLAALVADYSHGMTHLNSFSLPYDGTMTLKESDKKIRLPNKFFSRKDLLKELKEAQPEPLENAELTIFRHIQVDTQELIGTLAAESLRWIDEKLEPFPLWQFIQYYLPSLTASMMWKSNIEKGVRSPNKENIANFLANLVQYCTDAFKCHKSQQMAMKTKLKSEGNYEEMCFYEMLVQFRNRELNCIMDWLFLGKKRKNIFQEEELHPLHYGWIMSNEVSGYVDNKRMIELANLALLQHNNPTLPFSQCIAGNAAALEEAKGRFELLLQVARKTYGLPLIGSPIPDEPRLSNLYQAMAILIECDIIMCYNIRFNEKEEVPVKSMNPDLIFCKFYHEWNSKFNNLGNPDKFVLKKRFSSQLFNNEAKSNVEATTEDSFKNACEILVKFRKNMKSFVYPKGYLMPRNCAENVQGAIDKYVGGDLQNFRSIMNGLLFCEELQEKNISTEHMEHKEEIKDVKKKKNRKGNTPRCAACKKIDGYLGVELFMCEECKSNMDEFNRTVEDIFWFCSPDCEEKALTDGEHLEEHAQFYISLVEI